MAETPEHKNAKDAICNFFSENYGTALTEYLDSGFEADVSAVLFPVRKIMVEVIWSASNVNFYRDLTLVLSSDAEIKIVVVNPEIIKKAELVRYFGRIKQTEAAKGYSYIGLVPWDSSNFDSALRVIKTELDKIIETRKGKIIDSVKELKENIFNRRIPLPVIVSNCLEVAKELGLKNEAEWLRCELHGYFDYIKNASMGYEELPGKPAYRSVIGILQIGFGRGSIEEVDFTMFISQPINEIIAWIESGSSGADFILTLPTPENIKGIFKKVGPVPEKMPLRVSIIKLNGIVEGLRVALHKFVEDIKL